MAKTRAPKQKTPKTPRYQPPKTSSRNVGYSHYPASAARRREKTPAKAGKTAAESKALRSKARTVQRPAPTINPNYLGPPLGFRQPWTRMNAPARPPVAPPTREQIREARRRRMMQRAWGGRMATIIDNWRKAARM